jgi:hypothetical protein
MSTDRCLHISEGKEVCKEYRFSHVEGGDIFCMGCGAKYTRSGKLTIVGLSGFEDVIRVINGVIQTTRTTVPYVKAVSPDSSEERFDMTDDTVLDNALPAKLSFEAEDGEIGFDDIQVDRETLSGRPGTPTPEGGPSDDVLLVVREGRSEEDIFPDTSLDADQPIGVGENTQIIDMSEAIAAHEASVHQLPEPSKRDISCDEYRRRAVNADDVLSKRLLQDEEVQKMLAHATGCTECQEWFLREEFPHSPFPDPEDDTSAKVFSLSSGGEDEKEGDEDGVESGPGQDNLLFVGVALNAPPPREDEPETSEKTVSAAKSDESKSGFVVHVESGTVDSTSRQGNGRRTLGKDFPSEPEEWYTPKPEEIPNIPKPRGTGSLRRTLAVASLLLVLVGVIVSVRIALKSTPFRAYTSLPACVAGEMEVNDLGETARRHVLTACKWQGYR